MHVLQAVVLGAVQGLTEFIPVSSSAHLVILRWLFGWGAGDAGANIALDVALHVGTLLALLAYFWREWYGMIKDYVRTTRAGRPLGLSSAPAQAHGMLVWPVVFACIPAGLAGVVFENAAQTTFREQPVLLAAALVGLGALLFLADRIGKKARPMEAVGARDWIIVGLAQALAIVPGVSRSGITITAGLFTGLQRDAAARFSFLLGAPIIFGAAVYELPKAFQYELAGRDIASFALGVLTSTIVGYLCIGFLIRYLRKQSTSVFVVYRVLLGIAVLASYALGYLRV
ncbi:MAG TPA: undecaprenyl-diphosphatase UppP [Armatimonadota bacterium]|nr:undecaprenyl-diphosphatase UppP [Armatimonadota bacterium]